eukprot:479961_1
MQDVLNSTRSYINLKLFAILKNLNWTDLNDPTVRKVYIAISLSFVSIYLYVKRAKPNHTIPLISVSYYPYFGHYFWHKKLTNTFKDYAAAFSGKSTIMQISSAFSVNQIYVLDPKLMKTIFDGKYYQYIQCERNIKNKTFYNELLGNGLLTYKYTNNAKYKLQIKLINNIFKNSNNQQHMFECINYHSQILVHKIEELRNDGNRMDINTLLESYLYDLFINIYTGNDFGLTQIYPKQIKFHKAFKNVMEKMSNRQNKTFWKLQRMFGLGQEGEISNLLKIINKNILSIINVKEMKIECLQKNDISECDLLSLLLKSNVSETEIRDIIINLIVSSIKTTQLFILWTLYELSFKPTIIKQIQSEIDTFFQNENKINMDNINDDENEYFSLLDCCLLETLRLHPPICKRKYFVNKCISFKYNNNKRIILNKNEEIIINGYIYGRLKNIWNDNYNVKNFRGNSLGKIKLNA